METMKEKISLRDLAVNIFPYLSLIIVIAFFGIASGGQLFSAYNLRTIFYQTVLFIVGGLGLVFLFSLGAFDLSFGSNICFCSIITMLIVDKVGSPVLCLILPLILCSLIGLMNGLLFAYSGIMVFIQTLAVSFLLKGTYTTLLNGRTSLSVPSVLGKLDNIYFYLVVMLLMALVVMYLFNYTSLGKHCRMLGAGQEATIQCGVNIKKTRIVAFVLAGITAGLVAFLTMVRSGTVGTGTASNFEFNVMIALTLGGMPAEGGVTSKIRSVFIGCFIISVLTNGMVLLALNARLQEVIKGVIFILVLIFTMKVRNKANS